MLLRYLYTHTEIQQLVLGTGTVLIGMIGFHELCKDFKIGKKTNYCNKDDNNKDSILSILKNNLKLIQN